MGVQTLASSIRKIMANRTSGTVTQRGFVSGSQVLVKGTWYSFVAAVDVDISDGDVVWVVLNDTRTKAVVVGK